jgi:hypothetical protein
MKLGGYVFHACMLALLVSVAPFLYPQVTHASNYDDVVIGGLIYPACPAEDFADEVTATVIYLSVLRPEGEAAICWLDQLDGENFIQSPDNNYLGEPIPNQNEYWYNIVTTQPADTWTPVSGTFAFHQSSQIRSPVEDYVSTSLPFEYQGLLYPQDRLGGTIVIDPPSDPIGDLQPPSFSDVPDYIPEITDDWGTFNVIRDGFNRVFDFFNLLLRLFIPSNMYFTNAFNAVSQDFTDKFVIDYSSLQTFYDDVQSESGNFPAIQVQLFGQSVNIAEQISGIEPAIASVRPFLSLIMISFSGYVYFKLYHYLMSSGFWTK